MLPHAALAAGRLFRSGSPSQACQADVLLLRRDLGEHVDPDRNMLVTVVEFESTALMAGTLGVRLALVAYPVVSIRKVREGGQGGVARTGSRGGDLID